MRQKDLWMAIGLGALIGGIAAALYVPQSGSSTRRKLKRGLEDFGDNLEQATLYLKEQAERLSIEAQRLIDASKGQVDEALESANEYARSANNAAKAVSKLI